MLPILFEKDEINFATNGLARLPDCISCSCVEERNGIYEVDFEYPVDGANFDLIQCGRIIGVTHDETGDVESASRDLSTESSLFMRYTSLIA